jgi:hypothetical protein
MSSLPFSSWPGLTRPSMRNRRGFSKLPWMPGSSPGMTVQLIGFTDSLSYTTEMSGASTAFMPTTW